MLDNIGTGIIDRLEKLGYLKLKESLKKYTSFKTGGHADILISPYNHHSLCEIVYIAGENMLPLTIIGGATNILVGDKGIRGIVVRLCEDEDLKGRIETDDDGLIYADSITKKESFIRFCLDNGYKGMEFMAGIPGCIGGGIIMNAGTDKNVFADILDSITYIDKDGIIATTKIKEEMASYRSLKIGGDKIILGGYFRLKMTDNIDHVRLKIEENKEERRLKHPLDQPSAGSVFKNPPGYSSWKLINDAGLKGMRIGGAAVSDIHTNFIINSNGATSSDILSLVDFISEKIYKEFDIKLETEIRMMGEF